MPSFPSLSRRSIPLLSSQHNTMTSSHQPPAALAATAVAAPRALGLRRGCGDGIASVGGAERDAVMVCVTVRVTVRVMGRVMGDVL